MIEICGDAVAIRRIQVRASNDFRFQTVGTRIIQAEFFRRSRHQAFAGITYVGVFRIGKSGFGAADHQHLRLPVANGMQKSSQCSQIAVPVTAWGQIFGKEYDAIKFVCGKGFGKGVGVRHVDDSETVIAIYGAFSFRYHHMVSGKGMLNPLFGNEIGITDQKHFHAAAPVNTPLNGVMA